MFTTACLTLALGVSSAFALTVNAPNSPTSGGQTSITWTSTDSDPIFSIELNHPSFNTAFAIANNVDPKANNLTLTIPPVPAEDGYTLTFVNVTDINNVYATSGSFSIGAATSSSSSASASGSATGGAGASGGASGASGSGGASATGSGASGSGRPSSTAPSGSASSGAPSASGSTGAASSLVLGLGLPTVAAIPVLIALAAGTMVL
ncbi:hypothetical protein C8R43DRAFT_1007269 [Mycena crocata]|nr:hypothetical protein C8R43DRAFT_1007269 [Mycena crocata]